MDINQIKRTFELYLQVEQTSSVKVTDLAKELGIKRTEFMKFINENPKNFDTFHYINPKRKSDAGVRIQHVYIYAEDNPSTDEWLDKKRKECEKYIFIREWDNYGRIEGYYVEPDECRGALWRNTKKKIDFLVDAKILVPQTFSLGSAFDCSYHQKEYAITKEKLGELKKMGWTFNKLTGIE